MNITYVDSPKVTEKLILKELKRLAPYRDEVYEVVEEADYTRPEISVGLWQDEEALAAVYEIAAHFKNVKHVVLIGIGGQTLGIEAIHSVLYDDGPELHVLDTVAPHELMAVMEQLKAVKKAEQIAVVVSSKSGTTIETLTNASTTLDLLEQQFGKTIYKQTVFIGTAGSEFLKTGKKLGAHTLPFCKAVGGRYSVFTAAGLLPLTLLGHDIEALLEGLKDATSESFEETTAEAAARLYVYQKQGMRSLNFFAFDTRLVRLAKWYRQLAAESLVKEHTVDGKQSKLGFIPTISTAVELHSTGQLYFSGFSGVYTDFLTYDLEDEDLEVPKKTKLASHIKGKSHNEILTAIYGGVVGAYQERGLPYRATILEDDLTYSLGLFMGMRMLETMYLAKLMHVDAFTQPNVELYKDKTRAILGV